jgi:hypothetical protein
MSLTQNHGRTIVREILLQASNLNVKSIDQHNSHQHQTAKKPLVLLKVKSLNIIVNIYNSISKLCVIFPL